MNIDQDSFGEESIWATHLKWDETNGKQQKGTAEDDDLNQPKINSDFHFKMDDSCENVDLMENSQEFHAQYYDQVPIEMESPEFILKKSQSVPSEEPQFLSFEGTLGNKKAEEEKEIAEMQIPQDFAPSEMAFEKAKIFEEIKVDDRFVMKEATNLKKMKKNTNIPKFLVRIFMKHFQQVQFEDYFGLAYQFHQKIIEDLKQRENNNFKISDVLQILGKEKQMLGLYNRKIMNKILRKTLKEQVMKNKYIGEQHKKSYLIGSKMYALRCRSLALACRVQIH